MTQAVADREPTVAVGSRRGFVMRVGARYFKLDPRLPFVDWREKPTVSVEINGLTKVVLRHFREVTIAGDEIPPPDEVKEFEIEILKSGQLPKELPDFGPGGRFVAFTVDGYEGDALPFSIDPIYYEEKEG